MQIRVGFWSSLKFSCFFGKTQSEEPQKTSAIWPLENCQITITKRQPDLFRTFSPVFARVCLFLRYFDSFRAFLGCLFYPPVFALFRLLPFSSCHFESPDARKTSKYQGFFIPAEPLTVTSLERKGKTHKKARKVFASKKMEEIQKSKGRTGLSWPLAADVPQLGHTANARPKLR